MRMPRLLRKPVPECLRRYGVQVLCDTFAGAFGVRAPRVASLPADEALFWLREFSATCVEAALVSPAYAAACEERLGRDAFALGSRVRTLLKPRDDELADLTAWLYAAIDIEVGRQLPGELCFRRCFFSGRYTPAVCAFMSAFDSGFVGGLCGGGALEFSQRITEGAACCRAELRVDSAGCASVGIQAGLRGRKETA